MMQKHNRLRKVNKKTFDTSIAAGVRINVGLNDAINSLDNIGDISMRQVDAAHAWHQHCPMPYEPMRRTLMESRHWFWHYC